MNENSVVFKGTQNGIVVFLDPNTSFEDIKIQLGKAAVDKKKFFGDASANIIFKGRVLTSLQQEELLHVINDHTDLKISFIPIKHDPIVNVREKIVHEATRREPRNNESIVHELILHETNIHELALNETSNEIAPYKTNNHENVLDGTKNFLNGVNSGKSIPLIPSGHNETFFHRGSLRGGQSINYEGSVVVLGNVNPGSMIKAHANIVVLGSLKGVVHAGYTGNTDCFVAASDFSPTQLSIADIMTYIPEEKRSLKKNNASMAYIEDRKIYISPL